MKTGLLWSILLLCVASTCSQTHSDDAAQRQNAYKFRAETPHRVTMTVEMRDTPESQWEAYSSQVKEVAGKDRWHLVQHTGLKLELIGIGDRTYQKVHDGTWRLRDSANSYTGPTVTQVSMPTVSSKVIEQKDASKVVETRSQTTLQVNRTGEVVDMDRKTKEWFDESGRLVRVETEHFNFERKKFQRVTEVYEYDPTIRIEAPIIQ